MASKVGCTLGDYQIIGYLGSGAMSVVYEARHRQRDLRVAVKVMRTTPTGVEPAALIERFFAEVEALREFRGCPYVVQIHDWGISGDRQPYYVMDLVQGDTLEDRINDHGPYTPLEAFPIVQQLCIALQAVHQRRVVHRDLKPANIIVRESLEPRVVLLDFGIAKRMDGARRLTTGALGSPIFAAPEQVMNKTKLICPATDIYALGVLLYIMLSGHEPFDVTPDDDVLSVMTMRLHREPVSLSERLSNMDPSLTRLIDSCLAAEPDQRPGSANHFVQSYADALGIDPVTGLVCAECPRRPTCGIVPPAASHIQFADTIAQHGDTIEAPGPAQTTAATPKDPANYANVPPGVRPDR